MRKEKKRELNIQQSVSIDNHWKKTKSLTRRKVRTANEVNRGPGKGGGRLTW